MYGCMCVCMYVCMYVSIYVQTDFDRLHLRRSSGGRGLIGLVECVLDEEVGLAYYI